MQIIRLICFSKPKSLVHLNASIQLLNNALKTILQKDTTIDRLQYKMYKTLHDYFDPLKVLNLVFNFFLEFFNNRASCLGFQEFWNSNPCAPASLLLNHHPFPSTCFLPNHLSHLHLPGFRVQTRDLFHFCVHLQNFEIPEKVKDLFFYDKYHIVKISFWVFFFLVFQSLLNFSALRTCQTKIQCEMATWTAYMYVCPPQNFST